MLLTLSKLLNYVHVLTKLAWWPVYKGEVYGVQIRCTNSSVKCAESAKRDRWDLGSLDPKDRASRSNLTSLLPSLYTLTTQAITKLDNLQKGTDCPDSLVRLKIERDKISREQPSAGSYVYSF